MIGSAVALLRERSAAGVTIDAVLAHSGAPRGSVYHHFPGGRDQLILEAVRVAGRHVATLIGEPGEHDPEAVVRRFLDFWEHILIDADYLAGCPVVALTVDGQAGQPAVHDLVQEIFALWQAGLEEVLTASGVERRRSARLATLVIAAAEGAVLLCRAHRSAEPLHDVCAELCALLATVPAQPGRPLAETS